MDRYAVGIDLGTSNTVVAYAAPGQHEIRLFEVPQLIAPGEIKALPLLPSLRFHPAAGELRGDEIRMPWSGRLPQEDAPAVIGMLARRLGAQVPGRLVTSAKSWLSHGAVDRLAPILPWGADDGTPKVSPVDASASYLRHVRAAWNARFPDHALESQHLVLTVPASFDESARALTLDAARRAGLPTLRLLEEPQAAFYSWVFRHRDRLTEELSRVKLVLVCDVGGGTTDFSLIRIDLKEGLPELTRIGIGKHLMLGGDNMDLVLAHLTESRLMAATPEEANGRRRLSASQMAQLMERCRAAKEILLSEHAPDRTPVTLLGKGSSLIGGARSVDLTREEVERTIVDGFFPLGSPDDLPRARRSGIVEFGLPYASDAAITRHLAAFLSQHSAVSREALDMPDEDIAPMPDALLFNGGVFRAAALSSRLEHTLQEWRGAPLHRLDNDDPDTAVARGAVAYWLAQEGAAPKIGGGSPRNVFLLLDLPADEQEVSAGAALHQSGVCILTRGTPEGSEQLLEDRVFALRIGQPVRFHLATSGAEMAPRLGDIVSVPPGGWHTLPPLAMVLPPAREGGRQQIPVRLAACLTEVGTLELHCVSTDMSGERWKLQFELRQTAADSEGAPAVHVRAPQTPNLQQAIHEIDRVFSARRQQLTSKEVRQLRLRLEKYLGKRESWTVPVLRALFDSLWERAKGRRRSADHERSWLNLAGYCLRPGFGFLLDDWRASQLWTLFETGIQYRNDMQVRSQWWTLWRRVAGGLDRATQLRLLDDFAFNVQPNEQERGERPPHLVPGTEDDMLRLAASLERIPAEYKTEVGDWLIERLYTQAGPVPAQSVSSDRVERLLWSLARIGARQPFYGSIHDVVPPDAAERWLDRLLALDWKRNPTAAFAAAYIARRTGDRARDISDDCRIAVAQRLHGAPAASRWVNWVEEITDLESADETLVLGDSLPPGLSLLS